MTGMQERKRSRTPLIRLAAAAAAAGAAAASYMAYEARWVECRQRDLLVPGLPPEWSGLTVLHLSDVHAGSFSGNERSLQRVVSWAAPLSPDLVVLTGDVLGEAESSRPCLQLLGRLRPRLGMFAVTGNHEYGLSKAPLARPRDTRSLWQEAGATLLSDSCVALPAREDSTVVLCGADYLSGGYGLPNRDAIPEVAASRTLPILLIHDPPPADSPLADLFPLAFAGHTHGGQLRVPGPSGLSALYKEDRDHLSGVHAWGRGTMVITRGVGVSFLPFRLLTRPEATLWRLLYTSPAAATVVDH
jgi:predicted MPP superfamily phosphohydrolase